MEVILEPQLDSESIDTTSKPQSDIEFIDTTLEPGSATESIETTTQLLCQQCKQVKLKIAKMLHDVQTSVTLIKAEDFRKAGLWWIHDLPDFEETPKPTTCTLCATFSRCCVRRHTGKFVLAFSIGGRFLPNSIQLRIIEEDYWGISLRKTTQPDWNRLQCGWESYHRPSNAFCLVSSGLSKVSPVANLGMIKSWLLESQRHKCSNLKRTVLMDAVISPAVVIDCRNRTLVKYVKGSRFVALSYVWGPPIHNDRPLEDPPRTIQDAMFITMALGIDYLWVDRYCIDAKDAIASSVQIGNMDKVYSNAFLTIVALGNGPSDGIAGVNGHLRKCQPSIIIEGKEFVFTEDPAIVINRSKWFTRGWTYQEEILSQRIVYFGEGEMYFNCSKMYRSETFPNVYAWELLRTGVIREEEGITELWNVYIIEFSRKRLTFQSDGLNAMLGIFRHFEDASPPLRQHWGIPFKKMCSDELCSQSFVLSLQWSTKPKACRRHGFPSWSWVGWIDGLRGDPHGSYELDVKVLSEVWVERRDGAIEGFDEICRRNEVHTRSLDLSAYIHLHAWVTPLSTIYMDGHWLVKFAAAEQGIDLWLDPNYVFLAEDFDAMQDLEFFAICLYEEPDCVDSGCLIIIDDRGFEAGLGINTRSLQFSERWGSIRVRQDIWDGEDSSDEEESETSSDEEEVEDFSDEEEVEDSSDEEEPKYTILVVDHLSSVSWKKQLFRLG